MLSRTFRNRSSAPCRACSVCFRSSTRATTPAHPDRLARLVVKETRPAGVSEESLLRSREQCEGGISHIFRTLFGLLDYSESSAAWRVRTTNTCLTQIKSFARMLRYSNSSIHAHRVLAAWPDRQSVQRGWWMIGMPRGWAATSATKGSPCSRESRSRASLTRGSPTGSAEFSLFRHRALMSWSARGKALVATDNAHYEDLND